jgi:hypothetical protein
MANRLTKTAADSFRDIIAPFTLFNRLYVEEVHKVQGVDIPAGNTLLSPIKKAVKQSVLHGLCNDSIAESADKFLN